ncbi:FecR family protein [Novosphingobium resinovorum]|uniref:FecR family protein n=1 Tax=Novosphingobium resinovorum TaxID=158500 RepID=UPI002ED4AB35|nr:FecR domain-containing protein [Novosphingobium resinovorum]
MSEDPNSAAMRADVEALDWIVTLQESPDDPVVRQRFEQWHSANSLNAAAWEETARVYGGIGETRPVHPERWEKQARKRKPKLASPIHAARRHRIRHASPDGRRRVRRPFLKVALPAVAAAMLAVIAVPEAMLHWQADEIAGTGELREVRLSDGSHASLYPGSAIAIDYSEGERRIRLLRGQAWFEVHDESGRPFRVVARDVETTDIGTAFEVRLGHDDIHVGVAQGIVRVEDVKAKRIIAERLTAGQAVSIGPSGTVRHETESLDLIGAWRDGQLAVQDKPMSEVIEALRPWYGGMIVVRSDTLAQRRVTGVYDLRNPAGAMTALAKAYGGHVRQITPWLLILSES